MKMAINQLREAAQPDVDAFLREHPVPLVEGPRCTFLWRGEADAVAVVHRVLGLPDRLPMRRLHDTDLWWVVLELPETSRVEYQLEITRGTWTERVNDPANPHRSHSPVGSSSVVFATGYAGPDWAEHDPEARQGTLEDVVIPSRALGRDARVTLYLPARFRRTAAYPLLVVHDGPDYLQYAAAKTVLDNLLHRLDVAELVAAFLHPGDRLVEYANSTAHARFVTDELLPRLERDLPLVQQPSGRCLMGASFGAVASLATAYRHPDTYGGLLLQSGSFVFTDIGSDHGGGPVFDPVVRFTNRYRARPRAVADRVFASCGVYEPLITRNRSMVPIWQSTGMRVRYVESRDGHSWENWRDRLRDGLTWVFPGPRKYVYE